MFQLSLEQLRDVALEQDIDVYPEETRQDLLRKLGVNTIYDIGDPFKYNVLQYLPVKDVVHLSETDSFLRQMGQDRETWRMLSRRDFGKFGMTMEDYRELELKQIQERLEKWWKKFRLLTVTQQFEEMFDMYLDLFDILAWKLFPGQVPDLDIDCAKFSPLDKRYVFLRRIYMMHKVIQKNTEGWQYVGKMIVNGYKRMYEANKRLINNQPFLRMHIIVSGLRNFNRINNKKLVNKIIKDDFKLPFDLSYMLNTAPYYALFDEPMSDPILDKISQF